MFRPTQPAPGLQDRQTYIPPHIESAMADHVQQSLPAHLQKYKGGNTYIPQHAQHEMTRHLESSLPQHMKQYAGAYMQQRVVEPSLARRGTVPEPPAAPAATQSAQPVAPQIPVTGVIQPDAQNAAAPQPAAAPVVSQGQAPDQPYAFITNPAEAPKSSLMERLPGNSSLVGRIGLAAGVLLILVILFAVFRGLLNSGPSMDSFVTVTQQQQELIHLAQNASEEEGLSPANKNLSATIQASLASSQTETLQYMATNGKKMNEKQLNLKVSAVTDKQLTDAAAAGTYNRTFREIMQAKLNTYGSTLGQAYKQGFGPKGKALLTDSYRQQQLLITQLNETPDSTGG